MANNTIKETFVLPSSGLIYDNAINPEITLRSMTTMDEMKRTSPSQDSFRPLSEVIDDCMVGNKEMSSYDMCLGDYQFLMTKLRTVTYGADYNLSFRCPACGKLEDVTINLDEINVNKYDDSLKELLSITLPQTQKQVKLKYTTPRGLDHIAKRKRELLEKNPDMVDPILMLSIMEAIDEVDGVKLNNVKLEKFVQDLPMKDANYILNQIDEFNRKLGLDAIVIQHCSQCGCDFPATFRITNEFFRPTNS